jgi:hypothetical protein
MVPRQQLFEEVHMHLSVRTTLAALSIAGLAVSFGAFSSAPALAQAKPDAPAQAAPPAGQPPQIALTDKHIDMVLASQKEMDAIIRKFPNAPLDAKAIVQIEAVAKKYGFASLDEYIMVTDNINMVVAGIDPQTRKYVGSDALVRQYIAEIQADNKMKAEDKKRVLEGLKMAQKTKAPEIENKGNIDLVIKYYDKLATRGGQN